MWWRIVHSAEKNGLRKTTRGSLLNGPLYKVKFTFFEKSFFILYARTNERDHPPSFHSQLQVHTVIVTGKLQTLELYSQNYHRFSIMEKEKGLEGLNQVLDEREEFLVDRDRGVYDPFLSSGNVSFIKERLWWYNSQGNDILNSYKSFLYYFSIEQTLPFPEFVEWCASNYSSSERVIVSRSMSKILCRIDEKAIHGFLNLLDNYPDSGESVNESILAEVYRSCKTEV